MNLPLVLITYWCETLAHLFTGNDYSAILPFFPINGSGSQFKGQTDLPFIGPIILWITLLLSEYELYLYFSL